MATIHSLVIQPKPSEDTPPYRYNRVPVEAVTLIAEHGIEGDLKAGHHPNRQVNIMVRETLLELEREGWHINPGALGEQIVVSGLDLQDLPRGTQIQLGSSAIVELRTLRTGCSWLKQIQGQEPQDAVGRLGILGHVIAGGEVPLGAPVTIVHLPEGVPSMRAEKLAEADMTSDA